MSKGVWDFGRRDTTAMRKNDPWDGRVLPIAIIFATIIVGGPLCLGIAYLMELLTR